VATIATGERAGRDEYGRAPAFGIVTGPEQVAKAVKTAATKGGPQWTESDRAAHEGRP
jgi:hypothetical protein